MSQDNKGFRPLTLSEFDTLTHLLSKLLSTQQSPVIIPGEAILGIEAIAAGISAPGRKILNIVTGPYGDIFGKWLERGGAEVIEVKVPFDEVITVEVVTAAIERYNPCALSFVQGEAVTGGTNPTKEMLDIAHRSNLITVADSVSAIGGEPVLMDEWGIDFVAIGAQKALAGPNGISAVGISSRGWEFLASNEHAPRNSILSLLDLRRPHSSSAPLRVPANIPVLEARALIEALTLVEQEGLEVVNHRHQLASTAAIAGITALGLEPWQRKESGYSPLTTTVRIPQSDSNLRINEPIGIVAPGDGELYGKLLRINHFGANANQQSIEQAITTLAELVHQDPANAIAVQRSIWGNEDGR
ncbi:aspartate aminotransferase-like enzyme [Paenibacillus anaericanus]|uniref:pyridoxal-phosphate-dependent aminotransferase family protein n=1 Tax=Paenibacillus anaericanus TaxID=170367 RepID=UPI00278474ED|nr:aminotransferase class V-fold PLP-dependent enzyme [Paenibacillus anaericanus]MDQ0089196.1 aspartate aminotransferase-like enzyme [Paenibacillus anaericanus]